MKSKIEIELTEKEAGHLRTLLEGGIKISDSISQGEVFENILDHLNSQDQEEVKNPEYDGIREVERQKFKNIVDTVNKRYPQDTPEEWEEEFMEVLETFKDEICSNFFASSKPLTDFIKNLLSEREKEAYFKGKEYQAKLDRDCYGVSFEKLDKLTTK